MYICENVMFQEKYFISQYMGSKSVQENHLSQMMIRNSMSPEKEEEGEGEKKNINHLSHHNLKRNMDGLCLWLRVSALFKQ